MPAWELEELMYRNTSLHITDIHPDPFYKANSSVGAACHHNRPYDDPERAPPLGTAVR
jgi:endopolyphosphatase